jgi:hypothetical protein
MMIHTTVWVRTSDTQTGDPHMGAQRPNQWACGEGVAHDHSTGRSIAAPVAGQRNTLGDLQNKLIYKHTFSTVDDGFAADMDDIACLRCPQRIKQIIKRFDWRVAR